MSARLLGAAAALCVAAASSVAGAQGVARESRLVVAARAGTLRLAGRSEAFALMDRALAPGAGALRPTLAGGELRVRVARRWAVVLGGETGGGSVASASRTAPAAGGDAVRQRTALDVTGAVHLGGEWTALRWRGRAPGADDRLRLALGAGGGAAAYRLRQWGGFVDAERRVAYADDLRSEGRGAFGYVGAAVEVPVRRWVALQGDVRRQAGSAPMSDDFAGFDRLDLGGTRLGVGVVLRRRGGAR